MSVTELGMLTDFSELHPKNAISPMFRRVDGRPALVRLLQPENASVPMDVMPSWMLTDVTVLHPSNALSSMLMTVHSAPDRTTLPGIVTSPPLPEYLMRYARSLLGCFSNSKSPTAYVPASASGAAAVTMQRHPTARRAASDAVSSRPALMLDVPVPMLFLPIMPPPRHIHHPATAGCRMADARVWNHVGRT